MSEQLSELLGAEVEQVPARSEAHGAPQPEGRLEEDAEFPEQRADGGRDVLLWDVRVEEQRAFSPYGGLVFEAVAAVPAAGGVVAALVAAAAGVISPAVLSVARSESQDDEGIVWKKKPRINDEVNKIFHFYHPDISREDCALNIWYI